jgi:hypothetical protein
MTGYKKLEDAVAALRKYGKEKAAMLNRGAETWTYLGISYTR